MILVVVSLLPVLTLSLAGCGFQPLYGQQAGNQENNQLLLGVSIDHVPDRMGQEFRIALEDRLNPGGVIPRNPAYRLSTSLGYSEGAIGVARDGTVSRYNVYLTSSYALYRNSDGKKITNGTLQHVSSYNNITNEYFSTYVAQQDAISRGITELADLYRQQLGAYLTMSPELIEEGMKEKKKKRKGKYDTYDEDTLPRYRQGFGHSG